MGWIISGIFLYSMALLAEYVLIAVTPQTIEQLRQDGRARALAENPRRALAALLLARLLLKVVVAVGVAVWLWRHWRQYFPDDAFGGWTTAWVGVIAFFVLALTFWILKKTGFHRFTRDNPALWLRLLSRFIRFWEIAFGMFIRDRKSAVPAGNPDAAETRGANPGDGQAEKRDIDLLKNIVKFSDVTVKQVMQARSKVVAVDFRADFHSLLGLVREAGFSRLPVYDEDLDNVTGILYVKDLVPHLDKAADFEWQSLIRTNVLLVPEAKRLSEMLQEFKRQKLHMAVVVDEYGGSAGLVTMEDVLEEVIGEIRDEFDEESEVRYRKLDDFNYLFEGQTLLNDVCRLTGLAPDTFDDVRGDADTLAGLALELRGDIPAPGVQIAWQGFSLQVVAADNRRIEQLKLTLPRS